jgi:hypothetical protein
MLQTDVVEKIRTGILCSVICFIKSCRVMCKNTSERGTTEMTIWRMRIACSQPKATNTHTHTICSTYCFSTATMVVRTRLSVTLYVHCVCFVPTRGADWRTSALHCKVSVRDYRYVCFDCQKHVLQRSQHCSFVLARQAVAWMPPVRIL